MNEKLIRWIIKIAFDQKLQVMSPDELKQHINILKEELIDSLLDIIIP